MIGSRLFIRRFNFFTGAAARAPRLLVPRVTVNVQVLCTALVQVLYTALVYWCSVHCTGVKVYCTLGDVQVLYTALVYWCIVHCTGVLVYCTLADVWVGSSLVPCTLYITQHCTVRVYTRRWRGESRSLPWGSRWGSAPSSPTIC